MLYWPRHDGKYFSSKPAGALPLGESGLVAATGSVRSSLAVPAFGQLRVHLVGEMNESIRQNKYFFDKAAGRVFFANETFEGEAEASFALPGPGASLTLRSFRIYSLENGRQASVAGGVAVTPAQAAAWTAENAAVTVVDEAPGDGGAAPAAPVYKKGSLVSYGVAYSDYEGDPSLEGFWKYTHTPFNDGPHPDADAVLDASGNVTSVAGKTLKEAIDRFYIDGKYVAEHWQRDNTDRGTGADVDYPAYNKDSGVESVTFYIEGGGEAPWVTGVRTLPQDVVEGGAYMLEVAVDDREKDELSLSTEVYFDGKPVYRHFTAGIRADASGAYPAVSTGFAPEARAGVYFVVCAVSDMSGTGLGSHSFTVAGGGKVEGFVGHTDEWDRNRRKYNLKQFGDEDAGALPLAAYAALPQPRPRGANVFWPGERFMLRAEVSGAPSKVTCHMAGHPEHSVDMSPSGGENAAGDAIFEGSIWSADMIGRWGGEIPEELTFVFTAHYPGGARTHEATVTVDANDAYWRLHRRF
jgi:hypothetical protein